MAKTPLPEKSALTKLLKYDPDTGLIFWRTRVNYFDAQLSGRQAFITKNSGGYLQGKISGRRLMAHRVIWKIFYGYDPNEIDHINGIKDDNRIANLREVDRRENCKNTAISIRNTSGRVGVSWHKPSHSWQAYIQPHGKLIHLGFFADRMDAVKARESAECNFSFHKNHGRIP